MPDRVVRLLSTFFYIGYFPLAPGSLASVAGALIAIALKESCLIYISLFAFITVLGFYVSTKMEGIVGEKDPSCVVIDEVSGVMITFFLLPLNVPVIITAFFLFRAFDMFKIYPVSKFEEMGGGTGIMMDDIVAGIYANLTMHAAIRLAGIM